MAVVSRETKSCECGCGTVIPKYDTYRPWKERQYVAGHSVKGLWCKEGRPNPTLGKKRPDTHRLTWSSRPPPYCPRYGFIWCKDNPEWNGFIWCKDNPEWKGDNVGYIAIHDWVRRRLLKPKLCPKCDVRPAYDLANISGNYIRNLNDWQWLCRHCHMESDGRMHNLKQYGGGY